MVAGSLVLAGQLATSVLLSVSLLPCGKMLRMLSEIQRLGLRLKVDRERLLL